MVQQTCRKPTKLDFFTSTSLNLNISETLSCASWTFEDANCVTWMDGWIDVHFPAEKSSFVIKLFTIAGFCALCIVHCACRFFLKVDHLRNLMAIQLVFVWQLCYQLKWWSTRWKSIIHKITRLQTVSKPSAQPEWQSCLCTKPSSKGNGNYVCACDCQFFER